MNFNSKEKEKYVLRIRYVPEEPTKAFFNSVSLFDQITFPRRIECNDMEDGMTQLAMQIVPFLDSNMSYKKRIATSGRTGSVIVKCEHYPIFIASIIMFKKEQSDELDRLLTLRGWESLRLLNI